MWNGPSFKDPLIQMISGKKNVKSNSGCQVNEKFLSRLLRWKIGGIVFSWPRFRQQNLHRKVFRDLSRRLTIHRTAAVLLFNRLRCFVGQLYVRVAGGARLVQAKMMFRIRHACSRPGSYDYFQNFGLFGLIFGGGFFLRVWLNWDFCFTIFNVTRNFSSSRNSNSN